MKVTQYLLLAVLSLFSLNSAMALGRITHGPFLDGAIGWGRINETVKGINRHDMSGTAWNVNAGYRISRFWAFEAGYYGLPDNAFKRGVKGSENYAYAADVKAIVPYDNGFNIIGKAGIAASHHKLSPKNLAGYGPVSDAGTHTKPVMLLGLGVSYSMTQHLDVALQGTGLSHNGPVPAKIMALLGLTYTI